MLALLAGTGRLPVLIAEALGARGHDFVLCEMQGFAPEIAGRASDIVYRIDQMGGLFDALEKRGVTEVCFAGALSRPDLKPDPKTPRDGEILMGLVTAFQGGDDAAITHIIQLFEGQGHVVRAAHDVLPDLLPEAGILSAAKPSDADARDATRAMDVLAHIGGADIGQSCVVSQGRVLSVEALTGTDYMLRMLANDDAALRAVRHGTGGIFAKAPKPNQDRRADLPTIGPDTILAAQAAHLSGVVIEAGGVMVLDAARCVEIADETGLFLWLRPV